MGLDMEFFFVDGTKSDVILARMWRKPIKWTYQLTGKNNIICAKAAMYLGCSMAVLDSLYRLGRALLERDMLGIFFYAFIVTPMWGLMFPWLYKQHIKNADRIMGKLDAAISSGSFDLSMRDVGDLRRICYSRKFDACMGFCIGFFDIVTRLLTAGPFVWLLLSLSLYFATHGYPGGKSVPARIKEKVIAVIKSAIPVAAPLPA